MCSSMLSSCPRTIWPRFLRGALLKSDPRPSIRCMSPLSAEHAEEDNAHTGEYLNILSHTEEKRTPRSQVPWRASARPPCIPQQRHTSLLSSEIGYHCLGDSNYGLVDGEEETFPRTD